MISVVEMKTMTTMMWMKNLHKLTLSVMIQTVTILLKEKLVAIISQIIHYLPTKYHLIIDYIEPNKSQIETQVVSEVSSEPEELLVVF